MRPKHLAALTLFAFSTAPFAAAQNVPSAFVIDTLVSSGLTAPNDFCFLPDGRILIANRPGAVTIFANGTTATVGTVPNVEVGSERALLSIAADPLFAQNGHIYVWYSHSQDSFMHLDRFTCTGDLAVATSTNLSFAASSRRVILDTVNDSAFNHNGGSVRFGNDGMLYLSFGDDASSCAAQTLADQRGKLLRMDVSTLPAGGSTVAPTFASLTPSNNPLAINTDFSQLVVGYGLRNPVRMTVDPLTGNMYIGDVGAVSAEEYSEYPFNGTTPQLVNFGWPWFEGNLSGSSCGGSTPATTPPLVHIVRSQGWSSVMGGPRYRNRGGQHDFGAAYEGRAFYSDYYAGEVRVLQESAGTWSPAPAEVGQPNATDWATGFSGLVSYDVGPDGAIYLVQHTGAGSFTGGFLKRVRPIGPVDEVVILSGGDQQGPANEPFAQPLVVQVNDPNSNPLPGAVVNFSISGSGTLSTTNPVVADSNGQVQTTVTSGPVGGLVRVTASTPGGLPAGVTAEFFGRKMNVTRAGGFIVLQVINTSDAVPAQVPMIVMLSAPGIATLPTPIGPICTNPLDPAFFVIEDSIGLFSFATLSGSGAIGTPALSKLYTVPAGLLSGVTLWFQAVGFDPLTGWFRTNCELKTL
ncbi:MAG: PQQ-dependent sugar dehydrogenase, partial [Planctomycetota bacterium]